MISTSEVVLDLNKVSQDEILNFIDVLKDTLIKKETHEQESSLPVILFDATFTSRKSYLKILVVVDENSIENIISKTKVDATIDYLTKPLDINRLDKILMSINKIKIGNKVEPMQPKIEIQCNQKWDENTRSLRKEKNDLTHKILFLKELMAGNFEDKAIENVEDKNLSGEFNYLSSEEKKMYIAKLEDKLYELV